MKMPPPCVQVYAILQGADVVLTLLVVEAGGLERELNPVVRGLLGQEGWGIMAFVVLKIAVVVGLAYLRNLSDHRLVVLSWRLAVGYVLVLSSGVFIWNLVQLL